ncbi:hypothetical protein B0H14DRAFT_3128362 [Mycena olivaceomarginata]|nr:hypothetical protein B0H14DRAFT_3128362 [Mycena olivaceomarginata]
MDEERGGGRGRGQVRGDGQDNEDMRDEEEDVANMRIRSAPQSAHKGRTKSKEMTSADDRTRAEGGAARGWDVDTVDLEEGKTLRWGRRELRETRWKERYSESEDCSGYVSKLPGAATAVNVELAWDVQRKRNGKARSEQEVVTRGKRRMWKKSMRVRAPDNLQMRWCQPPSSLVAKCRCDELSGEPEEKGYIGLVMFKHDSCSSSSFSSRRDQSLEAAESHPRHIKSAATCCSELGASFGLVRYKAGEYFRRDGFEESKIFMLRAQAWGMLDSRDGDDTEDRVLIALRKVFSQCSGDQKFQACVKGKHAKKILEVSAVVFPGKGVNVARVVIPGGERDLEETWPCRCVSQRLVD